MRDGDELIRFESSEGFKQRLYSDQQQQEHKARTDRTTEFIVPRLYACCVSLSNCPGLDVDAIEKSDDAVCPQRSPDGLPGGFMEQRF
jgi:hypothetical protein